MRWGLFLGFSWFASWALLAIPSGSPCLGLSSKVTSNRLNSYCLCFPNWHVLQYHFFGFGRQGQRCLQESKSRKSLVRRERTLCVHSTHDIRNEQTARVRCEESQSQILARLLRQLQINGLNFRWISSINCHFHLRSRRGRKSSMSPLNPRLTFAQHLLLIELA